MEHIVFTTDSSMVLADLLRGVRHEQLFIVAESIDIGTYESCLNGCIYCYAIKGNYNTVKYNLNKHDKNSPMLVGEQQEDDIVKERLVKSLRNDQFSLF